MPRKTKPSQGEAPETIPPKEESEARDPDTPPARLRVLAKAYPKEVAQNPNSPPDLAFSLAEKHAAQVFANPAFPLWEVEGFAWLSQLPDACALALAAHPEASPSVLDALTAHASLSVLQRVVKHPATRPDSLARVLHRGDTRLDAQLAKHPKASEGLLRELLLGSNPSARAAARKHPKAPRELIQRLLDAGASPSLAQAGPAPQDLSQEELAALADLGDFGLFIAAHQAKASPELLQRAEQRLFGVALLRNPATPAATLARLAKREDFRTKHLRLFVAHPHCPIVLLRDSAVHIDPGVRKLASQHPKLPGDLRRLVERAGASPDLTQELPFDAALSRQQLAKLAALGGWAALLAARHPKTPPASLAALTRAELMHPGQAHSRAVLRVLAENPKLPKQALALFWNKDGATCARILCRPLLEKYVLPLWQKQPAPRRLVKEFPLSDPLRAALLGNPNLRASERAGMSPLSRGSYAEQNGLVWLAQNPSASPAEQAQIANSGHVRARAAVARAPGLEEAVLAKLMFDVSPLVRTRAAQHPNAPRAVLETLWRAGASPDLKTLSLRPLPERSLREVGELFQAGPFGILLCASAPEALHSLITKKSTKKPGKLRDGKDRASAQAWAVLARSVLPRFFPWMHPKTTIDREVVAFFQRWLSRLWTSFRTPAYNALSRQALYNPHFSPGTMSRLVSAASGHHFARSLLLSDPRVTSWLVLFKEAPPSALEAFGLAQNPACPVDLLEKLSMHATESVRGAVALNPAAPPVLWMRLLQRLRRRGRWFGALHTRLLLFSEEENPPESPWGAAPFPQSPRADGVSSWVLRAKETGEVVGMARLRRSPRVEIEALYLGAAYQALKLDAEAGAALSRLAWVMGADEETPCPVLWLSDAGWSVERNNASQEKKKDAPEEVKTKSKAGAKKPRL
jgi:hypothetical protein